METTAAEVLSLFNVTRATEEEFSSWKKDRNRCNTVVPHVLGHKTKVLYRVTPADIDRIRKNKDPRNHALGDIKRREGEMVGSIVDWEPDYAVTHVLHYALEEIGEVFTWQHFQSFCEEDPKAREMLWMPAIEKVEEAKRAGWSYVQAHNAMRWRIGNFYYSFIREVHLVASLRMHEVDVRSHPLADALFRVDAWWDRTILSLYIGNRKFKGGGSRGRKKRPEDLLRNAIPGFSFRSIELLPADRFGVVYLASERDIKREVNRLKFS
ncbi:hypothetical protein ABGB12_26455 [Actinocorallia sp. B10E7]|uniref:hypothetical protein n=1 Tax=Actinocorallia sp. B10E7 TaxID=3153558 RepID=UPI00325E9F4A